MRRYLRCPGAISCPARRALRAVLQPHIRFCDEMIADALSPPMSVQSMPSLPDAPAWACPQDEQHTVGCMANRTGRRARHRTPAKGKINTALERHGLVLMRCASSKGAGPIPTPVASRQPVARGCDAIRRLSCPPAIRRGARKKKLQKP